MDTRVKPEYDSRRVWPLPALTWCFAPTGGGSGVGPSGPTAETLDSRGAGEARFACDGGINLKKGND